MFGECQVCGGEVGLMGMLGNRAHLLCRQCGTQSSTELSKEELDELHALMQPVEEA